MHIQHGPQLRQGCGRSFPSRKRIYVKAYQTSEQGTVLPQAQILPGNTSTPPMKVEQTAQFLRGELNRLFTTGDITKPAYSNHVMFEDPLNRVNDINAYQFIIKALTTLFKVTFDLHDVSVTAPDTVTTRWTMSLNVWELPWRPTVLVTGRSYYTVDPGTGLILQHKDVWDSVDNNRFLSLEAVGWVAKQVLDLAQTPNLETPKYTVLKVTKDFEVRHYEPFVVAEAPMGPGSSPAAGSGFNELAGYIFGNNRDRKSMEMTTPVFSQPRTPSGASSGSTMQFVMERKLGGPETLPEPVDPRVTKKQLGGSYVAALRFGGIPLDFEVVAAEKRLREALLRDGLEPKAGYRLARYNEPWQPLPFRRNEILIDLTDFRLA